MRGLMLAAALLITGTAEARPVGVIGGSGSCGKWTVDRREFHGNAADRAAKNMDWVAGFLSGLAVGAANGANPLQSVDADGLYVWLDNYCRDHPVESLVDAASAFYRSRQ